MTIPATALTGRRWLFVTVTSFDAASWLVRTGRIPGKLGYLDVTPRPVRPKSVAEIQVRVADRFRIRVAEMTSARRGREVARPRQVAMYLSRHLTKQSLPEIGRRFGNRDHTTVIHACRQIEKLRALDPDLDEAVCDLERELAH